VFESQYQEFIFYRTYSRWLEDLHRRERWGETVNRYREFFLPRVPGAHQAEFNAAVDAILALKVMPSMRALWTAGEALDRDNIAGYNCAYLPIDSTRSFAEILHVLMNWTGVGWSVESRYVNELPTVPVELKPVDRVILFADSKRGWAEGLNRWLNSLYRGEIPRYDLSKIRPKGAPLKTFGGRASGPEPLKRLLDFCLTTLTQAAGRKLTPLECHDIACMVADSVVVGGVRRSAGISLGDLHGEMRQAKQGSFPPIRWRANISVAYDRKPSVLDFLDEWYALILSKAGERGIFNRQAAEFTVASTGRREVGHVWGVNPCGEILLRPYEFCNLSEVIVRHDDSIGTLLEKVRFATILGVLQSTLTKFQFINQSWRKNCEEERLLGVSLTGLMDHPVLNKVSPVAKRMLTELKEEAIDTARRWSTLMGIPMPKAITCVKPSGTVSQLVNASSGIHPRFAPFYLRRVEVASTDPLAHMLIEQGVPHVKIPEGDGWKFEFPIKSPESSRTNDEMSAIQQLEYWLMLKTYWCEHNPSCTIYVRENEWMEVGAWVWNNWNSVCGLTFFPRDDTVYELPPYEEIDEDTYNNLSRNFPVIDFGRLPQYERRDQTAGAREFACAGGACEL
jgi:ribonucleoside-diphosphate reductase alpha chain